MRITATVMAHPKRKMQAEYLEAILNYYPFAEVSITYDQKSSEWDTGTRALRKGVGKGDWHVVIQDDAILTPEFYQNIENMIIARSEKTLISLYTGTARPLGERVKSAVDRTKDGGWLRAMQLFWGVGIVIPSDHIEPMLEFVSDMDDLLYDVRIGEFYLRNGLPVYYCMPSLVDHDDDLGSLLGHGQAPEPRVAHRLAEGLVEWGKVETWI